MTLSVRILGIDPSLRKTGWGVIDVVGNRLTYVARGHIGAAASRPMAERLYTLAAELEDIMRLHSPDEAAIEETFVNTNPRSALQLGQARGVCLMTPARFDVPVSEYAANTIKKSVVGAGHAQKSQVETMVRCLLPCAPSLTNDEADALAVAICHAHHRTLRARVSA